MMDCQNCQDVLSAYIDDALEIDEKLLIEQHLEKCPHCLREYQGLQETIGLIQSLREDDLIPPASMRRELRQKLEQKQRKKSGFASRLRKMQAWLPLAAAAVLLLFFAPLAVDFNFGAKSSAPREQAMDNQSYGMADYSGEEEGSTSAEHPQTKVMRSVDFEQKIIKTGYLNLEIKDYQQVIAQVKEKVQIWNGYILNEESYTFGTNNNLIAGSLQLRVPQAEFETALTDLEDLGKVRNRSSEGQDVTEEYIDLEARLGAMRLKEDRLTELLAQSGSLGDVLAVENELANTRADLEALEGRLRYLSNRTNYSTINLQLRETLTPSQQISTTGFRGVIDRTQQAFIRAINTIITGVGNGIVFIVGNLPYLILALGFLGSGWFILGKYRIKK